MLICSTRGSAMGPPLVSARYPLQLSKLVTADPVAEHCVSRATSLVMELTCSYRSRASAARRRSRSMRISVSSRRFRCKRSISSSSGNCGSDSISSLMYVTHARRRAFLRASARLPWGVGRERIALLTLSICSATRPILLRRALASANVKIESPS
uniref:Uncharacterized protein n=1 Tax=Lutzomyia longipalpis TaxID=7200 RepID=A0A7G3B623_LUTLO